MAPNLKKISLLVDDSFLDASSFLAVKGGQGDAVLDSHAQPSQPQREAVNTSSSSYWDWPAPPSSDESPAADLFSAEHLQSNLIQASAERSASTSGNEVEEPSVVLHRDGAADSDDYWAERSEPQEEVVTSTKVPLHHPLNLHVSSDNYWRDARGERLASDAYWSHSTATKDAPRLAPTSTKAVKAAAAPVRVYADKEARELADQYWDESLRHARTCSDVNWNTGIHPATDLPSAAASVVSRALTVKLQDAHSPWVWSHERTESDQYWAWETPSFSSLAPAVRTC